MALVSLCRAPGTMGLLGNLWAGEIQEQLIHARMQKASVFYDVVNQSMVDVGDVGEGMVGVGDVHLFGTIELGMGFSLNVVEI